MRSLTFQLLLPVALFLLAACRPTLQPSMEPPDRDPTEAYDQLLSRVITEDGYVDYARLEAEREALDAYVAWLGRDDLWDRYRSRERLAVRLNAFTAWTLYRVLEEGRPAEGIGWAPRPGLGFYTEPQFALERSYLSLSELAHERIRLAQMTPRMHGALTCAAVGCPPMRNEAWGHGSSVHAQLQDQLGRWVDDDRRGVRIEEDRAVFSPIFKWFAADFERWEPGRNLCVWTARYAGRLKAVKLMRLAQRGCPHGFFEFDGRLNSVEHATAP